jgi:hypothetical protein
MIVDSLRHPVRRLRYIPILVRKHCCSILMRCSRTCSGTRGRIDIIPMTGDITVAWHQRVQPLINARTLPNKAVTFHPGPTFRA